MKRFKTATIILVALAAAMILSVGTGSAIAYFTTYAVSEGGKEINFSHREELREDVTGTAKAITITNNENSQPVFVRARAFTGSVYTLTVSGENWTPGSDGWYYYADPLNGGESTKTPLNAVLSDIPEEDLEDGDTVNVAVVYESTLALYEYQNGDYEPYADWSVIQDSGRTDVERGGSAS